MDWIDQLQVLSNKHLGEDAWNQLTPRAAVDALLAMAFVEQWNRNGREAYFLVRVHALLQQGSDQGET